MLIEVQGDADVQRHLYRPHRPTSWRCPPSRPFRCEGVLRSESDSVIAEFLSKYLRDPEVTGDAR